MLGSNPTADSVDSTDRNGDASASPFQLRVEARSGEAGKREILGGAGQSPRGLPCFRYESLRPLINPCIIANALIEGLVEKERSTLRRNGYRIISRLMFAMPPLRSSGRCGSN
jgi:hypothetical protein